MADLDLYGQKITLTEKQHEGWSILIDKSKKFIKFWGGSRSGKTFIICLFIVLRAVRYKNSVHIICRYDKAKAKLTVWRQTVLPLLQLCEKAGVCRINVTESRAEFNNGSSVLLGGLRPSDIGNILSAEYATFFICEANELSWDTIDLCRARLNSQAIDQNGNKIQVKFLIDLNPTFSHHWSNVAWILGQNPDTKEPLKELPKFANLYWHPTDNKNNLSDGFIETLESLTGSKRKRFWDGQYGSYDGLVYSCFNESMIIDDFVPPNDWIKIRAVDFGYSKGHAFVCLWLAIDPSNERVIVYREYVKELTTVRIHAGNIKELSNNENYQGSIVCDHDAEDRATLEENGLSTMKANKSVLSGIDNMIDFIERGKFAVCRSCVETINEFFSYIWKTKMTGLVKDREVVKDNDNCLDTARYGLMELFPPEGSFEFIEIRPQSQHNLIDNYS